MAQNMHARSKQPEQHQQRRQRSTVTTHNEVEEDFHEETVSFPYRTAYNMAEKLATTRIGQFIISRGDRLLKIIESTAKWSLPQDQMEDKLQRPLPWIPFLMVIVMLRVARMVVSIGAMLIGNAPVRPQDVVYFVQTRRRKLRALRLRGIKEICRRNTEMQARKPGFGQNTFMAQMKRFFSTAICRPGLHREPERRIMIHQGKEVICGEIDSSEQQIAKRRRDDDCEADMTVDEMLNKYANDNTEDDSDFIPNPADEKESDDSTTSSDSTEDSEINVEGTTAESKKTQEKNTEKRRHYSKDTDTSINRSVEFKENGNGEPVIIPKPIAEIKMEIQSESETSEMAKTPHANGPSNGPENRELDVAFKFVLTPPDVENRNKKYSTPELDVQKSHEAKTGHKDELEMEQQLISTLKATTVAATEKIPTIDLTSTDTSSDAVDSTFSSSPTLSAASSSTSLDSLKKIDEILTKNAAFTKATSTPITEAAPNNDLESSAIAYVSSSEDDFYSPIGSPPDFNAYQKNQINQRYNSVPSTDSQSRNMSQKTTSEPNVSKESTTDTFFHGNPSTRRNPYQSHGIGQQGRYRGRNRR